MQYLLAVYGGRQFINQWMIYNMLLHILILMVPQSIVVRILGQKVKVGNLVCFKK